MPSVVGVRKDGSIVVGTEARQMLATDPANVIPYPRRVIGRLYRDPQIAGFLKNLPMHTTEWSNGRVVFHAQGREFTAPQLCAPILQTLRLAAERFIGERVTEVVLTTPLGFNSTQVQALALAAGLAGLEVTQFVEEPVAAALANRTDPGFHNLVGVYDFGGGTFDYSVINLQDNRAKVITTAGDTWLGGEDFEENLANVIADNFWRKHQVEVRNSKVQWQRLLVQAEQAKQELSNKPLVNVTLPEAALTAQGQLDISFSISRTKFVELTRSLIDRSLATCQEALDQEGLKVSESLGHLPLQRDNADPRGPGRGGGLLPAGAAVRRAPRAGGAAGFPAGGEAAQEVACEAAPAAGFGPYHHPPRTRVAPRSRMQGVSLSRLSAPTTPTTMPDLRRTPVNKRGARRAVPARSNELDIACWR